MNIKVGELNIYKCLLGFTFNKSYYKGASHILPNMKVQFIFLSDKWY